MKWQIDFGDRPWHRWFAWYPVQYTHHPHNGTRVWWEYVERNIENVQGWMIRSYRPVLVEPLTIEQVDLPEDAAKVLREKAWELYGEEPSR